jgi:copper homeostasis protein
MKSTYVLEITVETTEGALAAERGGANRIELCGDLGVGGVTPSLELLRAATRHLNIPVFAMVRPRAGDFLYSAEEFTAMKQSIEEARQNGADGVVLGVLKPGGEIDVERTQELIEYASPLPVTFHRAFDESRDLQKSLEDIIQTGATRVLTSGGAATAPAATEILASLAKRASGRIIILPGSGINPSNIARVAKETGAREFHSGLSTALPYGSDDYQKFENEVRKLAEALATLS